MHQKEKCLTGIATILLFILGKSEALPALMVYLAAKQLADTDPTDNHINAVYAVAETLVYNILKTKPKSVQHTGYFF